MQTVAAEAVLNVVTRARAEADVELPQYRGTPGVRWSRAVLDSAWRAALARGTTPFELANETQIADWGLLGFVVQTAPTAEVAVAVATKLLPLITQRGQLRFHAGERIHTSWHSSSPTSDEDHAAIVSTLAHFVVCVQSIAGPASVRSVSLYDRSFGARDWFRSRGVCVAFGASCPSIAFADLSAIPSHAHERLFDHLCADANVRIEGLPGSFAEQVRQLLCERPESGPKDVARALAVSQRSLRRSLAAEGTSLSQLTAQLRQDEACCLLRSGAAVAEVSDHLGFSDPSAFARAFRRWTGTSPKQFATSASSGDLADG